MSRPTGIFLQRPYLRSRENVLFGAVRDGEGVAAETRTGAARLLPDKLNGQSNALIVAVGALSNASGGYWIEVAHVPIGGTISDANPSGYVRIGSISFDGMNPTEAIFSKVQLESLIKANASPALTVDPRVVAIRLVAGTGTGSGQNGLAVPTNATGAVIHYQPT
jgi:hypothetical protein